MEALSVVLVIVGAVITLTIELIRRLIAATSKDQDDGKS